MVVKLTTVTPYGLRLSIFLDPLRIICRENCNKHQREGRCQFLATQWKLTSFPPANLPWCHYGKNASLRTAATTKSLVCIICYPSVVHVQQSEKFLSIRLFVTFSAFLKCFVFRDAYITEVRTYNVVVINMRRLYNITSYLFRIFVTK